MDLKITVDKKNIRDLYTGINDFKNGYQPGTNIVKGNLVTEAHIIFNR
jgi:hypothetical protein